MSAKFIEVHYITRKTKTTALKVTHIINTSYIADVVKAGQSTIITLDSGAMIRPLESYDDIRRMLCGD